MNFETDKQTYNDLDLLENLNGEKSIFSFFNYTKTKKGKKTLDKFFANPLSDIEEIKKRIETIKYLQQVSPYIRLKNDSFDFIEIYLYQQNVPNRYSVTKSYTRELKYRYSPDNEFYLIKKGVKFSINLLNELYDYSLDKSVEFSCQYISDFKEKIRQRIENTRLKQVLDYKDNTKLYPHVIGKFDYLFRKAEATTFNEILHFFYELDAYNAIAFAAEKFNFTLPAFTNEPNYIKVEGLYHPFIQKPVKNDFEISNKRICMLTGPNMAGKSTFLKSLSISVFLSHMGFPVPAKSLKISHFKGVLTTINLSDNINKGYSHFYNEVLRVKCIAEKIRPSGNLFVVFDELFRGTNVKDAFEASYSVIDSLSKINKGFYFISTHIIEAAERLKANPAIKFQYFEANMVNDTPNYTYRIKEGITDERLGLYILNKEKVIETIENSL